jgi:hypothetical protein
MRQHAEKWPARGQSSNKAIAVLSKFLLSARSNSPIRSLAVNLAFWMPSILPMKPLFGRV